jgi:hypothetical protein
LGLDYPNHVDPLQQISPCAQWQDVGLHERKCPKASQVTQRPG